MIDSNNLLTIVLTLKDRSPFTYRWMDWMNLNKCPYKILIADGGSDKELEKHLKDYANYPNLNYEYLRYPYDETLEIFYDKWNNVIQRVETPYTMLTDNDDFVILDHLNEKISFLEQNKAYSCYLGKIITFDVLKENQKIDDLVYGGDMNFYANPPVPSIENANPSDRTINAFESYVGSVWYSIMRTDISKIIAKEVYDAEIRIILTIEFYMFLMLSVFGKIKTDDKLHYIRQRGTSQASNGVGYEGREDYLLRLFTPNWQYDYALLTKCIVKYLHKKESDFKEENYLIKYREAYRNYIIPTIKVQVCDKKIRFFKLKTIILNSKFLSKILLLLEKIIHKKIAPLIMDVNELRNEVSIPKLIEFMYKNNTDIK